MFASYSADGVNFTEVGRVLPFFTDNPTIVHWDERIGKYVIYTRAFDYDSENQRRIGRIETDDPLQPWPYNKTDNDRHVPRHRERRRRALRRRRGRSAFGHLLQRGDDLSLGGRRAT